MTPPPEVPGAEPPTVAELVEAGLISELSQWPQDRESNGTIQAALRAVRAIRALEETTHVVLTQGHPKFGIACTLAIGDEYVMLANQPSVTEAVLNARAAVQHALDAQAHHTPEDRG